MGGAISEDDELLSRGEGEEEGVTSTGNTQLDAVLDFYECDEVVPFCERIIWLANVKEALGGFPNAINLDYTEIRGLVIYSGETQKKMQSENLRARRKSDATTSSVPSMSKWNINK